MNGPLYSGDKLHTMIFFMKGCFFMQPFIMKYKKQLLIAAVVGIAVFLYFTFSSDSSSSMIETIDPLAKFATTNDNPLLESDSTEQLVLQQKIIVDVKGAVHYPGVYTLTEGQRIVDAIEMAGGYVEQAYTTLINHAQKLQDEMIIYIPKIGEEITEFMPQLVTSSPSSNIGSSSSSDGKVNINSASESEFTTLPSIGPSKARAIINHREEHGRFQTVEDLKNVTGIGEKTFEQLKEHIDVK